MKSAIVLCSGGIDSVTTAYYVRKKLNYKKILILFFDYGQKSAAMEKKFSRKCAEKINAKFYEIKIKELGKLSMSLINKTGKINRIKRKELKNSRKESEKFYVPCRNIIFLAYSLAFAESIYIKEKIISNIFVGFKNEGAESYPDTTMEFVKEINSLSQISCLKHFKIIAPMIKANKEEIISIGKKLGVDFKETTSCYIGKKEHCGFCLACRLRQEGFYWADIKDPTKYAEKMKDFRIAGE